MALINFENFPHGMVSGIGDDELEFFADESSSRFLKELSNEFMKEFDDFESAVQRFCYSNSRNG